MATVQYLYALLYHPLHLAGAEWWLHNQDVHHDEVRTKGRGRERRGAKEEKNRGKERKEKRKQERGKMDGRGRKCELRGMD